MFLRRYRRIPSDGKSPEEEAEGQAGRGHEKRMQHPKSGEPSQVSFRWEAHHDGDRNEKREDAAHRCIVDIGWKSSQGHEVAVNPDRIFKLLRQTLTLCQGESIQYRDACLTLEINHE